MTHSLNSKGSEEYILKKLDHNINSKTFKNASTLALELNSQATDSIEQLKGDSDIYLICIKDDYIEQIVLKRVCFEAGLKKVLGETNNIVRRFQLFIT